jgi:hypothetical protein
LPLQLIKKVDNPLKKISVYYFYSRYWNLPITKLTFQIPDKYFYRYFKLFSKPIDPALARQSGPLNAATFELAASWSYEDSGVIYRYQDSQKLDIDLSLKPGGPLFKVIIENYNDQPLQITKTNIFYAPHKLVFNKPTAKQCRLYLGFSQAPKVNYDLTKVLKQHSPARYGQVEAGSLQKNPHFKRVFGWWEQNNFVGWILIVIICGVLVFVIINSWRNLTKEHHQKTE